MTFIHAAWEQLYGLLVEDGQTAVGTLLAFGATAVFAYLADDALRDAAGWVLFALLMGLLVVNLVLTARRIRRSQTS
jgi:hypothetical protein